MLLCFPCAQKQGAEVRRLNEMVERRLTELRDLEGELTVVKHQNTEVGVGGGWASIYKMGRVCTLPLFPPLLHPPSTSPPPSLTFLPPSPPTPPAAFESN